MDFIQRTRKFSPALAQYLQQVAEQELNFKGEHPLEHSRHNHVHLWKLEAEADHHPEVNLDFRVEAIRYILQSWSEALRQHPKGNYLFYLYQDFAPTVSIVRETPAGFPYGGTPVFVQDMTEVMRLYMGRSWQDLFRGDRTPEQILDLLRKQEGSLSRTARTLGWSVADLRKWVESWDLGQEVNTLRKHFKRRPAQLKLRDDLPYTYRIHQTRLEH
ncbi:hypothetical protein [Deinococcus cellulosilyticus]|uniref:Uncharacterized protein n=1 Tax=Deinococcus cellulosilyticus (strain DSM 18568 / NBRC 106333 / KACC 11606 / 5516J-15) TaxID=1223518 RepID=A0A511MWW8_DEIC1|nr:hypothetical protein [Deinococcus cellulosilyticus]GEM45073.1 hypothetical protein DC3_07080 [Deinococcus cellulosilyticus NBRC 106333 = KACC 11606]